MVSSDSPSLFPIIIISLIVVVIVLASILDLPNTIAENFNLIYWGIQILFSAVYLTCTIMYARDSDFLQSAEPESPLGILISRGFGPVGNLVGEWIEVFAVVAASKVLAGGIILGRWSASITVGNRMLISLVTLGIFVAAGLSVYQRFREPLYEW